MTGSEQVDGLDGLYEQLYRKRSGWHWQTNAETGAIALFPNVPHHAPNSPAQRALEDAWEVKAIAQAEESERMERANRIEAKAEVNTLAARKAQIVRGN